MSDASSSNSLAQEDSALDWFVRCLLLGLLISLGVNATSYFFHSNGIVDLIGKNNQVDEAIGFPEVFWQEKLPISYPPNNVNSTTYSVSVPYADARIYYPALGWNLMLGLALGVLIGIPAIVFRKRMNALVQKKVALRIAANSNLRGGYFQISMRGILLLTTVVALTIAVFNQLDSIERKPVESSNLVSMGYNRFTQTLEVEFSSGSVYQYFKVPKETYRELESADSLGRYLSKNIRDKFPYESKTGKPTSGSLLAIYFLGPIYLFTFAVLLNRVRPKTRYTLAAIVGAGLVCIAMSEFVRLETDPERVLMGLFICWTPQIAFFATLISIGFVAQAYFLGQLSRAEVRPETES